MTRRRSGLIVRGRAIGSISAFAFQSETDTLAAAFGTPPTTNRKRQIDRTIRRLKSSGVWTKARWLQFVGADADASLRNWKTPSEICTVTGTPTFTADQSYVSASAGNYLVMPINASVLSQNDHGFYLWSQTGHMTGMGTQASSVLGAINAGGTGISIVPRAVSPAGMAARCGGTNVTALGLTDCFGLMGASRSSSANFTTHYNGVARVTSSNTSAALPALAIHLLGLNNNGTGSGGNGVPQSFWYFGQALTTAEVKALTAIVGEYMEAIRYGDYYCEEPGIGTASISKQVVAYGLTGQSVCFAAEAARQGKTVAIVGGWRDRFSFGMAGGGLGYTDYDAEDQLGGLPRWIWTECNTQEGVSDAVPEKKFFLSKRFNRAMRKLLNTFNIPVYLSRGVSSVAKTGTAITSITTADGRTITASQWHDGSYEGDLSRLAGLSYNIGREAAGSGAEAQGGVENITATSSPLDHAAAALTVDPWVTVATPASGLLPGVHSIYSTFSPGIDDYPAFGTTDSKVPAYNFRLTITTDTTLKVPFPSSPPTGFDAANYELLIRWIDAAVTATQPLQMSDIFKLDNLRSTGRYDANNKGMFSTDFIKNSESYPLASYATRETIWKAHWNYILGLWYVLQYHSDARIPSTLRTEALTWGMCADHYYSPHENDDVFEQPTLYVREAIRVQSDVVMTGVHMEQADGATPTLGDHTVSCASYSMDSHDTQRVAHETSAGVWAVKNEGGLLISAGGVNQLSPLPFEIFVPKVAECTNLSFSFGASLTHVAYGATRMEFTAMQTGQSMGLAAALAINGDNVIQNVPYASLRTALLASPSLSGEVAPILPQTT